VKGLTRPKPAATLDAIMGPESLPQPLSPAAVRLRLAVLATAAAVGAAVLFLAFGRMPQDPTYHHFADRRTFLGVPHALNVLSNAPFLLVGLLGVALVLRRRGAFLDPAEAWPYAVFFVGVALTCFGSAYYHLDPTADRLVWDRLPIAMAFMALFAAVIGERVGVRAGLALLGPLMALGLGSVLYWTFTESRHAGDLRLYYFVQGYPLVAIPLLLALFPARYTRGADLLMGVAWYAAAKVCELYDREVYRLLGEVVSGHTIKHLLSAAGAFWVWRLLALRRPYGHVTPGPQRGPDSREPSAP
jgi:hypothetical protein